MILNAIRWLSVGFALLFPALCVHAVATTHPGWALIWGIVSLVTVPIGLMSAVFAVPGTR